MNNQDKINLLNLMLQYEVELEDRGIVRSHDEVSQVVETSLQILLGVVSRDVAESLSPKDRTQDRNNWGDKRSLTTIPDRSDWNELWNEWSDNMLAD